MSAIQILVTNNSKFILATSTTNCSTCHHLRIAKKQMSLPVPHNLTLPYCLHETTEIRKMCESGRPNAFERLCSAEINGVQTNFVFHRFRNKFFLIITQNEKMSNVLTVRFEGERQDDSTFGQMPTATPPLNILHNFGKDTDEVHSAVQFIVSNSKLKRCTSEIMISLGLKEINGKSLREIVKVLDSIL